MLFTTMKKKCKREGFKKIIKKYPILEKYIRIFVARKKLKNIVPLKIVTGKENQIKIDKSAVLDNCKIEITGNYNDVIVSEAAILNNVTLSIRGDRNKITINPRVKFIRGGVIWIEDYECEANIGECTTFEDVHIAVTEPRSKVSIGSDCMFAYDIDVRTGDSHSIIDTLTNKRVNYAENITIGNHVWVASHVTILKGVRLLNDSVVATRAVVTKAFNEKNILIGGIPATKLRENIQWDRKRIP